MAINYDDIGTREQTTPQSYDDLGAPAATNQSYDDLGTPEPSLTDRIVGGVKDAAGAVARAAGADFDQYKATVANTVNGALETLNAPTQAGDPISYIPELANKAMALGSIVFAPVAGVGEVAGAPVRTGVNAAEDATGVPQMVHLGKVAGVPIDATTRIGPDEMGDLAANIVPFAAEIPKVTQVPTGVDAAVAAGDTEAGVKNWAATTDPAQDGMPQADGSVTPPLSYDDIGVAPNSYDDIGTPANPNQAPAPSASPDQVWGKMIQKESGNSQTGSDGTVTTSPKGAQGVAQLMPKTAQWVASQIVGKPELADVASQPTDEGRAANLQLGRAYFDWLVNRFGGDTEKAAAAYNAGQGAVDHAVSKLGDDWLSGMPAETRDYVAKTTNGSGTVQPAQIAAEGIGAAPVDAAADAAEQAAADAHARDNNADTAAQPATVPAADTQPQPIRGGHIDENHADLYQLGQQALAGNPDLNLARDLSQRMGPLMDWTDVQNDWAKREKRVYRQTGQVAPQRMVEAAKDYVSEFDTHGPEAGTSFYDPDKLHEAMVQNAQPMGNPIPTEPTAAPVDETISSTASSTAAPDLTDQALDLMRAGKGVRVNRGPSLLDFLSSEGGIKDEGGELTNLGAEDWHRSKPFRSKLVNDNGMTLEDAADKARDAGYLLDRDGETHASPDELLGAVKNELAGNPLYAVEDPMAQALRDHIDDLDQITSEAGIDINSMSNQEVKDAIQHYFDNETSSSTSPGAEAFALRPPSEAAQAVQRVNARVAGEDLPARGTLPYERQVAPNTVGPDYQGRSVRQMISDLNQSLGLTTRRGRIPLKKALGTYNQKSGVIRMKYGEDLNTLAHEAGHALEFSQRLPTLEDAMKTHEATLKGMDYEPKKARRHEGFAEFLRHYITNPDVAKKRAGGFYHDFENALAKDNPKALKEMRSIRDEFSARQKANSSSVLRNDLSFGGKGTPMQNLATAARLRGPGSVLSKFADKAYTELVDGLHPIQVAVRKMMDEYRSKNGKSLDLKAANNPMVLARLARTGLQRGEVDVAHGVVPYHGIDPVGTSLPDAIAKVLGDSPKERDVDDFDVYLIARRMVHEWDRFKRGEIPTEPSKFSKAVYQQHIADFEAKFGRDKANAAAQGVYEWVGNLWKKEYDAGFITKAQYEDGLTKSDYVPLMRDRSDVDFIEGAAGRGTQAGTGGVNRFRGSLRAVVSPISSMIRRSYELNTNIGRNDVYLSMWDLAKAVGADSGAFIEQLPRKELSKVHVDALEALDKAMRERGVLSPMDMSTVMAAAEAGLAGEGDVDLYRMKPISAKPGETIIYAWRDGVKTPLQLADGEFGRDLFTALSGMDKTTRGMVQNTAAFFSNALRKGVTLDPGFAAANIFRDQFAASMLTDSHYVPGIDTARAGVDLATHGDWTRLNKVAGGMSHSGWTQGRSLPRTNADLQAIRNKVGGVRSISLNPLHAAEKVTDFSELSTRLGVMRSAFLKAKREGMSDYEAAIQAGITSRDYLDFDRHGASSLGYTRVITFLNASIQSVDKMLRVATGSGLDAPGRDSAFTRLGKMATSADKGQRFAAAKLAMGFATIGGFSGLLWYMNNSDPDRKRAFEEFTPQERGTNWFFKYGSQWYRIPKPFELALTASAVERSMDHFISHDPKAAEGLETEWFQMLMPMGGDATSLVPAIVKPALDIYANKDSRGYSVIPDSKLGVDPEYQYNAYTSQFSRWLGRQLNTSPAILDDIITDWTGSLGQEALDAADYGINSANGKQHMGWAPEDSFFTRRFTTNPNVGTTAQQDIQGAIGTGGNLSKALKTFSMLKTEDPAKAQAYYASLPKDAQTYVAANLMKGPLQHPLDAAKSAVGTINDIRSDVRNSTLAGGLALTPSQMRQADTALVGLATAVTRNALITVGERGWENRQPEDISGYMATLDRLGVGDIVRMETGIGSAAAPMTGKLSPEMANQMWAAGTTQNAGRAVAQAKVNNLPILGAQSSNPNVKLKALRGLPMKGS